MAHILVEIINEESRWFKDIDTLLPGVSENGAFIVQLSTGMQITFFGSEFKAI